MPLTEFQRGTLRLLSRNRGPESFVAGGLAINAAPGSPRYSADVDIFHDAQQSVVISCNADLQTLADAGFTIERLVSLPAFQRVDVTFESQSLRLEWAQDSAFRFFPIQEDADLGWRLHLADLATNKVLALAGRWEVRDFVDTLYLHESFASLGLLAWAAAGKDPGLTPALILEQAARFNRLRPQDFLAVFGTDQFDYVAMKSRWLESVAAAWETVESLPPDEMGAFYLDEHLHPVDPRLMPGARAHYASVGGTLPRLAETPAPLPADLESQAEIQAYNRYGQSQQ